MGIVGKIIDCCLILIIASYLVSRYLDIKDQKTKNRVKTVIFCIMGITIIVMIIFLIYFCKTLVGMGTV